MTFQVKAEILLNNSNWERQLKKTEKQLKGFEKVTKQISGAVKAAWVGIATLGVSALTDAIVEATKAAADERKSVALLNSALDKNWKATDKTKQTVEDFITQQQNLTGIMDDKLRPAFAKIALVTKKPEKAMKSFALAMDISAGTGKDLNIVSQAMAKYLGGNKSALDKLVPGLKDAGNKMAFLQSKYAGMAEVAGRNDPFARINAIMDDFKEKIGKAFLPLADQFADWLAGPDAQKGMDQIAKWVSDTFSWFQSPEGKAQMEDWYQKAKQLVEQLVYIVDKFAEFLGMTGKANSNRDVNKATGGRGGQTQSWSLWDNGTAPVYQTGYAGKSNFGGVGPINISVNGSFNDSGKFIVKSLKQEAGARGTTVGKIIGG